MSDRRICRTIIGAAPGLVANARQPLSGNELPHSGRSAFALGTGLTPFLPFVASVVLAAFYDQCSEGVRQDRLIHRRNVFRPPLSATILCR
jgi:hypothetical protein